jgi:hypothetical protein
MIYIKVFKSKADVIEEYKAPADALDGAVVLLAWYGYGDYCGESLVVFKKDGKLWEVNGSHCSCMGLEEQWKPEETSWEALKMRKLDTECDSGAEAQAALNALIAKHI